MRAFALIALVALSACKEEIAVVPEPVDLTEEALAHFCQMNISEHPGPKGQVHLEGHLAPIFFAQVRDMVAYLKSPERDAKVMAIYVSDMGAAASWDDVAQDNWIAGDSAHFVVDAGVAGGMGAPEIVPFASVDAAAAFIAQYGGEAVTLAEIPDAAAIGPVDLDVILETPT